jgi:hypothetical protein
LTRSKRRGAVSLGNLGRCHFQELSIKKVKRGLWTPYGERADHRSRFSGILCQGGDDILGEVEWSVRGGVKLVCGICHDRLEVAVVDAIYEACTND